MLVLICLTFLVYKIYIFFAACSYVGQKISRICGNSLSSDNNKDLDRKPKDQQTCIFGNNAGKATTNGQSYDDQQPKHDTGASYLFRSDGGGTKQS
ncbi:hypothetical protein SNE40_014477 [Patella caerulea]|uniref:Uncharacterized protein n=1 Tax=Patella caerulea TaxID=87958 RepID=A0AAN8JEF6_PATCE